MLDPAGPVSAPPSSRWKSSFVGVSTRGTLHGRAVTVALRASYAQRFNYNWLKLDLACRSPWPFEIKPRSAVERLLEKWEGSQTDTELDESLSVVSDAPLFYDWVRQQPVSQQILSLVTHHHLAGIGADPQGLPGVLRFSYTPVVFQSGRLLAGMPGALQEMEAFAVAVESSSMASAQPASGSPRQADSFVNAPPSSSAVAGGIRLKGLVLIMLGIALLSGVPASLVSAVVGQRGLLAASLITMLPWVGVGMIVAGVVLYRTPPHRV
jgi:hypothetical protein